MLIFVQATVKVQVTKNLFYNILTCTAIMDGFTLESVDVKGGLQDGLNHVQMNKQVKCNINAGQALCQSAITKLGGSVRNERTIF